MNDRKSLLIVDDDEVFLNRLGRSMERKGFTPTLASSVSEGKRRAAESAPDYAVIDLRLQDGNGLEVVEAIRKVNEEASIVMLTGYGNIASAVAAVKAGAIDYLAKPANVEDIVSALLAESDALPTPPENPMSADRVRWEHIQRVYELCDHNVSETARRLNMHRRTLQRIMAKRSPQ
ncbi:MAG: two-component system response regulator [Sneathiella sp.]|jgi:two-component system response regulator RegA|uniref:ActR/PrrA/RegA family redox response regulator transcription factor n=1 Tax=Sneathiella sp. TaxID=1964365 RepID=UPI000C61B358|nr:ActR/PrrA/RegA family redox response regulator transcription factor [Sneathiella sp.]MAL79237.1 two-component system response regulator [Sneathiella sp.]|tara:strand:- start:452 stop:982 length:531 start_codon:yes stop_codon:yes gene_type:complete